MAQKESTFLNMTLTLFIITAVAAVALASVYNLTKEPIENVKKQNLKNAIGVVIPEAQNGNFDDFEKITVPAADGSGEITMYKVVVDGKFVGMAVQTFSMKAFAGYISIMVGFRPDGTIIDSDVLEHKETPGLGDKSSKRSSSWNEQFIGKNPATYKLKVKKDGGDVDAITAATITSRSYCDALQRAYDTYMKYLNSMGEDITSQTLQNNVEPKDGGNK